MRLITAALAAALTTALTLPAFADGRGRGHGYGYGRDDGYRDHGRHYGRHYRHDHDRYRGGVYFNFGPPRPRYYYPERRVVVIERPVVVERPVIVQAPPGVTLGGEIADGSGRYCREYQTTGRIAGRVEQLWGVACLQPDGSWDMAG